MASRSSPVAVALLSDGGEFGAQLRATLAPLGAAVVYEAAAGALDRAALERSHANVVVVNLDAHNDPHLDEVYELLDDARYRVVFNDAEASRELTGWDQARWMRHLAAKVLGDADIDPPRPADAQAVPAPVVVAAFGLEEAVPPAPVESAIGFDGLAPIAAASEPALPDVERIELSAVVADDLPAHALGVGEVSPFDLDALIDVPGLPAPPPLHGQPAATEPVANGGGIDLSEFGDFDLSFDEPRNEAVPAAPALPAFEDFDDTLAAPASAKQGDSLQALGLELDPLEPVPVVADSAPRQAPATVAAPEWSLEEMLEEFADPPPAPPSPPAAEFGIEKLSAEEFLAPPAQADAPPPIDVGSGLSLELVPLEEAVAPTSVEAAAHENWFDPDAQPVKVRRVWVLGASIGGPEAVREFLAGLPRDYPALFLLAQHLGAEFVDMMARQLAQATPLTVRMPTHGERVGHGEIVIVPTSQRLRVDAQGVVVLQRDEGEAEFKPSIDRVLRDAADRFGAAAGAIVFSGMSSDAIEGCRYLAAKGGLVYAQRQDTCVVSSMVDGVCDTGVVSFLGSPAELAEKLLADAK